MRKEKVCKHCESTFTPTGQNTKYCSLDCRRIGNIEQSRINQKRYHLKQGRLVGVGKGGATGFGKNNAVYKHGLGTFTRLRRGIKEEQRYCGHCSKDLLEATHYQWVIHHIDHNKYNNPEDGSNWVLLCKRCHQIEHKCWKGYEGATTSVIRLSNGRYARDARSSQEGSETPDIH